MARTERNVFKTMKQGDYKAFKILYDKIPPSNTKLCRQLSAQFYKGLCLATWKLEGKKEKGEKRKQTFLPDKKNGHNDN